MPRLALIAPLVLASAAQAGPGFYLVGYPPVSTSSGIFGVSADGSLAVGGAGGGKKSPGFTWTALGGRDDFGLLEGMPYFTPAYGVSSDGAVIVGFTGTYEPGKYPIIEDQRAYRRIGNGSLESLGVLPNRTRSFASGVSGDGQIVVGTCQSGDLSDAFGEAFIWRPQTGMTGLGFLKNGGTHSKAYGISRDGTTIVGMSQSLGPAGDVEAFTWTQAGGMKKLPELPGAPPSGWCEARDVNGDGSVVVGHGRGSDGFVHAMRWVDGAAEDLSAGIETSVYASATDDSGDVVGGTYNGIHTFVWTPGSGLLDLHDYLAAFGLDIPADYRLEAVTAISGDGLTFAGQARNLTTMKAEGFVATVPSPATVMVLFAPCFFRRRRG